MVKIVEKKTIDAVETAKLLEKYESVVIPFHEIRPSSIRTYISNARKEGRLEGQYTVNEDKIDEVSIITRIR